VVSLRFHDLRHSAGLLLTREVGIVAASRVLGHANPTITARFYGHAHPEDLQRGLRGVADRMWGGDTEPPPVAASDA